MRGVEGEGEDAVGEVEGLLDAVAVVDVDVDVKHARMHLEQLKDRQHDVVRVAEATRLTALGVVQAAGPVDDDIGAALIDARGAPDRAARVRLAIFIQPVENRAVIADVEALEHRSEVRLLHVLGRDCAQEVDVLVRVEGRQVAVRRRLRQRAKGAVRQHVALEQLRRGQPMPRKLRSGSLEGGRVAVHADQLRRAERRRR